MKRDLVQLSRRVYDVLVVGGGIYGVCIAWDAALRGLSVALVDKGDFGHATSFNSLRVIHGGLRYLQHLGICRMRESIRERAVLMRIAPHLVHPMQFVIPTYGHAVQGKEIMALALMIHNIISLDRNRQQDPQKYLPRGRVISRTECLRLIPGVQKEALTGGAIWYDCQMRNSERLALSFLQSAVRAGTDAANYVEAIKFLRDGRQVKGIRAQDHLTGNVLDVCAKIVVNASGPWVNQLLRLLHGVHSTRKVLLSKAMNIVVNRPLVSEYAIGVVGQKKFKDNRAIFNKGTRLFFIVPWHPGSLIGTTHLPFYGDPDDLTISEGEIEAFVAEINTSYPAAALQQDDIQFVYSGLLPMNTPCGNTRDVSLTKRFRIDDHAKVDGTEGLVSVVGVKYTEARYVAEKVIDLVCAKLGQKACASRTAFTPICGGHIEQFGEFLQQVTMSKPHGINKETVQHLIDNYGSEYQKILQFFATDPTLGEVISPDAPVLKAEVLHACRDEMAMKLADVVFRRTELGRYGNLTDKDLHSCANIMAKELGWDRGRIQREVEETRAVCKLWQSNEPSMVKE
jgi:glycerol-3-phosphate dehydrogenase